MVNKVTLIGNLGKDPELQRTDKGIAYCKLSIATNESYKDKSGEWQTNTEWHTVVTWREAAEKMSKVAKGSLVYVEAKLTYHNYENKEGQKVYVTQIVANYCRVLDKKEQQNSSSSREEIKEPNVPGFNDDYDDLPF